MVEPIGYFVDGTIGVVGYLGDTHAATLVVDERLKVHEVVALSEDVGVPTVVADAWVVASVAVSRAHDVAFRLPRACGAVAHSIAQRLGAAGGGIAQIVMSSTLVEPGAFLIVFDVIVELGDAAFQRSHVVVQKGVVGIGVAPVHIGLPVVIRKDGRVDVVPVLFLPDERLAERVVERAVGRVADEDTNAVPVKRGVEVVFTVALYRLDGPRAVVAAAPGKILQRGHSPVLRPVHHVRRGP